jgi:hypothetical protein
MSPARVERPPARGRASGLANLVLHLHPPTVPERALRFSQTLGLGGASLVVTGLLIVTGVLLLFVYEPSVTAASFLLLGGLTAADRRLSPAVVSAIVGLLHGWLNGAGIAEAQREALGLAGIAGVVFVLVALASAFVVSIRIGWMRIAVPDFSPACQGASEDAPCVTCDACLRTLHTRRLVTRRRSRPGPPGA